MDFDQQVFGSLYSGYDRLCTPEWPGEKYGNRYLNGVPQLVSNSPSTGYIVDHPLIRNLVETARARMADTDNDAERLEKLKPAFQQLLEAEGWLPDEFTCTGETTDMGGGIAAYALYRAEDASLCVFSFVIPADTVTPIHDHGAWGLVGIYRGEQAETYYRRLDDGSVPGKAELEQMDTQTLTTGEFYPLLPEGRDIHSVGSTKAGPSLSIHLLANDTGCVDRNTYDLDAQTVKYFRSGWSNVPCNDSTS